ncbi:tryptophan--tRNA ligase [Candidatus Saccharibacteria bacterium]|nr:tryptophan--tRNA ligase [Candidatus Saccharibacteria bacterium]MCA9328653.1 tryptophan--tRNA ligase [Candidatus Saccharibacteria bacterium]
MSKQVVLTGLRTNAEYHLGNYLGALLPMVDMAQNRAGDYQVNIFAPDLHSFTTPIGFSKFHEQTMHNLKLFVACGFPLDHEDVFMYRQSHVPAHSELAWILSNFTGFGEMSRMVEFKDKSERIGNDRVSVGLFSYPILMAADILLYGATYIPVGEDQRQHLEFTRDIAMRMNNQFGELFVVPETLENQQKFVERESAPRIRSLRDPSKKMSKSVDDPSGTILLSDNPDEARKKVMRAETDNVGTIHFNWDNQPGITNLLQMLALLTHRPQSEIIAEWEDKERYGDLKSAVADAVVAILEEIQANMAKVSDEELLAKLESSEAEMNKQANQTLLKIQKAVGLR